MQTLALSPPPTGLRSSNPQTLSPPAGQSSAGGGQCGGPIMSPSLCLHYFLYLVFFYLEHVKWIKRSTSQSHFHQQFQRCHTLPNKQPLLFSYKTRFTAHLSEAVADLHPLMSAPPPSVPVSCSGISSSPRPFSLKFKHVLVLGGGFRSHSTVWQCGPLWQAAPYASKRWLTSWQGCGDNTALYSEEQCSHSQHWELTGRAQHCFHTLQLTTWDQNNCTKRETYRGHGVHVAYSLDLVCYN